MTYEPSMVSESESVESLCSLADVGRCSHTEPTTPCSRSGGGPFAACREGLFLSCHRHIFAPTSRPCHAPDRSGHQPMRVHPTRSATGSLGRPIPVENVPQVLSLLPLDPLPPGNSVSLPPRYAPSSLGLASRGSPKKSGGCRTRSPSLGPRCASRRGRSCGNYPDTRGNHSASTQRIARERTELFQPRNPGTL
jgi:hypothetical protein